MSKTTAISTTDAIAIKQLKALYARVPSYIKNGMQYVVRTMLNPYAREMRKFVRPRRRTGLLGTAIKTRVVQYPNGAAFGIVGPARDVVGEYRRKRVIPAFYAHLVEYGTRPHAIGKGSYLKRAGKSRPQTQGGALHPGAKPHPYRAPALIAGRAASLQAGETAVKRLIDKSFSGGS